MTSLHLIHFGSHISLYVSRGTVFRGNLSGVETLSADAGRPFPAQDVVGDKYSAAYIFDEGIICMLIIEIILAYTYFHCKSIIVDEN